ncbi:phosphatidylinositol-glycan biosynthesis class X protein-like isoform X2 [Mya arenaria]|uniref:phosphatidylinositol-glycan biosynthesis class X protein-like isoform X2 n=1 Tax=Mya arenaria TaxID=6604 RepID=UPI0022E0B29F|nr:phosphatidylinositol-glycan biosynthesis class X protein-like isoform X2 [Mya arenaria]
MKVRGLKVIIYILLDVCVCFSTVYPKFSRSLDKTGFHRELLTSVDMPRELLPDYFDGGDIDCHMLFREVIPSGAYVDPFQLQEQRHFGGPDVKVVDPVDVEKPEVQSFEIVALVYANLTSDGDSWVASYSLPIHLRYHSISPDVDNMEVIFQKPEIFLRCNDAKSGITHYGYRGETVRQESLGCSSSDIILCDWSMIQLHQNSSLHAWVPVGKTGHFTIVTVGTVIATTAACFLLIAKALKCYTTKGTKDS